jgi:ketosteroid isomerase-like protein
MTTTTELVERMWRLIEGGDLSRLGDLVTEDVVCVQGGARLEGAEQLRTMLQGYVTAFGDMRHEVVDVIGDGDKVAVQLHVGGTHTGPMVTPMGEVAPTGNRFELDSVDVVTARDGRIAEWLAYYDPTPIYVAIGLAPDPAGTPA